VWLNTPRRPLEASGTSGMKVPVNGGVNMSVLDGWWCEGYKGNNGWAIGLGEEYEDLDYQDGVESLALYDLLENEVAPTFYRRGADGLPRDWIAIMKASMREVIPVFNTNRMVEDYCEQFYLPASLQWKMLSAEGMAEARRVSERKRRLEANWHQVRIVSVRSESGREYTVGESMPVSVRVDLGPIDPTDVTVEAVAGPIDAHGEIQNGEPVALNFTSRETNGLSVFSNSLPCATSGRNGFSVRVIPSMHRMASNRFETRLITWWGDPAIEPQPELSAFHA
jgi:starch phosphorylase